MKKILQYFLLLCLLLGCVACPKIKSPEPKVNESEFQYIDNSYNNYLNNDGALANVGNRIFYRVRGSNAWGGADQKLLEITEEGTKTVFDKQIDLSIYPGENNLYIFGGDVIPGALHGYTQKNYNYDLNKNELVRNEQLENNIEYYKFDGKKAYHSNNREYRNTVNILCDGEVLLRELGYPSAIYITDDYIYYTDELARKYGIMRYDLKTKKSEQVNELESIIVDKHEGCHFEDCVVRTVSIDEIIVEDDYLVYLKSSIVNDEYDFFDYECSIEINKIVEGKLQEINSIALPGLGPARFKRFNIYAGTMYYCVGNSLFSYELISGKTKKLFTERVVNERGVEVFIQPVIEWISILDNRWLYMEIAGNLYKVEQNGGQPILLVEKEEDDEDYNEDGDYHYYYDDVGEIIGTLTALVSGINYRSSTEITTKSQKGSLKKGESYIVYGYAPCWPFQAGEYLVKGWFLIRVGSDVYYVADIEGQLEFNEYQ